MLAACYEAWKGRCRGRENIVDVAQDKDTDRELNRLARADRVAAGRVAARGSASLTGWSPVPATWS